MKKVLIKLLFGNTAHNRPTRHTAYRSLRNNLINIWNNQENTDIGIERVLRLFLVSVQVIFPGLHLRNYFGKKGTITRNLANEFYVLFKTLLPLFFLYAGLAGNPWCMGICLYLLCETICYVSALIFVSDMFVKPRSYRRNILMLFFNYLEICLSFGVFYSGQHLLNDEAKTATDFVYFSIVTSSSIGYGDIYPVTALGKIIVSIHALLIVSFVVLFLNFFSSKVEVMHNKEEM